MTDAPDYKISKLEKGPLQRFKNQNLLLKKFGEVGLQVYKVITGKRTTSELQKDLGLEKDIFDQIIGFMHDAGMVELTPVSAPEGEREEASLEALPEEIPAEEMESRPEPEPEPEHEMEDEHEAEGIEAEEEPEPEEESEEGKVGEDDIAPIEPIDDIEPIEPEPEEEEPEPKKKAAKKKPKKEDEGETDLEPIDFEPIEEAPPEPEPEAKSAEPGISPFESWGGEAESEEGKGHSPVEKIIFDKYGDVGLKVYALIDGQRTAEEIMGETGLTESKLVEILDFMDEQGIIKLDYPKQKAMAEPEFPKAQEAHAAPSTEADTFAPMTEGDLVLGKVAAPVPDPVEVPKKAPLDFVKSVQLKAQLMLKFRDKGQKLYDLIDGENDVLDLCLKLDVPLFELYTMLQFMIELGMVSVQGASRDQVRKKYGDDGFAVYKRYGREGLLLYELIGKEMTMIQMADRITRDRAKVLDMFIFIHKVLGIELPIDRSVLAKQLGINA